MKDETHNEMINKYSLLKVESKKRKIEGQIPRFCGRPGNRLYVMFNTISGDFKLQQKSASGKYIYIYIYIYRRILIKTCNETQKFCGN